MAKIVVVEDETELRGIIVDELEDMGHTVIQAADGEQGLHSIVSARPDIIISDINMPRVNGFQLQDRLKRNHPDLARIPFIFLTARAGKEDIADGMMTGADHYLTKPINFDFLQGVIKDFLH